MRTLLALFCILLAASAHATERRYTVTHDRLIDAAIEAIADEAHVYPDTITQVEIEGKGGRVTRLHSPYIDFSRIQVDIDSSKCGLAPALKVQAHTDKIMNTEHYEWEQRLHEVVLQKLTARTHGDESKPTALPPTPVVPPKDSTSIPPKDYTPETPKDKP